MSGVTASKRVKPAKASTSRSRCTCMTLSIRLAPWRPPPSSVRQPPRVEVAVDRHVVTVALGDREDCFELYQLHRTLV